MYCDRCNEIINEGDERELNGQVLCEDCCMDLMSPAKACDPWAVYTAKSLQKNQGGKIHLNSCQEDILRILEEGPTEPSVLSTRLAIKIAELEREIAALRHMEKVRGELRDGKRFVRLWD